jgi:hypothetical protein
MLFHRPLALPALSAAALPALTARRATDMLLPAKLAGVHSVVEPKEDQFISVFPAPRTERHARIEPLLGVEANVLAHLFKLLSFFRIV